MTDTSHVAFFGEAEHTFRLGPAEIVELERKTEAGIGLVFQRVGSMVFYHSDLVEIIRLGLVGGGMHPEIAKRLTDTYATPRPLTEVHPLAFAILKALWVGPPKPPAPGVVDIDAAGGDVAAALKVAGFAS